MLEDFDAKLSKVLAEPESKDDGVTELAGFLSSRLLQCSFHTADLEPDELQTVEHHLDQFLHWCIHIGQSAWQLSSITSIPAMPSSMDSNWRSDLTSLQIHIHVAFCSEESLQTLVSSAHLLPDLFFSNSTEIDEWEQAAVFTRGRLEASRHCAESREASDLTLFQQLVTRLVSDARLYISLLHWLVSAPVEDKSGISDCFVNLCAVAHDLSGDVLRLLWAV